MLLSIPPILSFPSWVHKSVLNVRVSIAPLASVLGARIYILAGPLSTSLFNGNLKEDKGTIYTL